MFTGFFLWNWNKYQGRGPAIWAGYLHGVQGVGSSSLLAPTNKVCKCKSLQAFFCGIGISTRGVAPPFGRGTCMGCKGSEVRVFSPRQMKSVNVKVYRLFFVELEKVPGAWPRHLGGVLAWGARGRKFESSRPDQ